MFHPCGAHGICVLFALSYFGNAVTSFHAAGLLHFLHEWYLACYKQCRKTPSSSEQYQVMVADTCYGILCS